MADYDALIIGGGIHGVGVAQALAAAGYRPLLLEQSRLGDGSSSRSSKLIHGGLRYLESRQWRLVRECLLERQRLLQLAPELVQLQPFHIPVYQQTSRRPMTLALGLGLYRLLSGFQRASRFQALPRRAWSALDGLRTQGLQMIWRYYDGQTDDRLLTRAVMASAVSLGAEWQEGARVVSAELGTEGVELEYEQYGRLHHCRARVMINATGPWVAETLGLLTGTMKAAIPAARLVQGSHLILDYPLRGGCYYLEAPQDRRVIFVMPWQGKTLVGTTETPYQGDPATVSVLDEERRYLQTVVAHYFPRWAEARIKGEFAGLRVLPESEEDAFSQARETRLHVDDMHRPRLLSIYGGKLTSYRLTAQKVVQRLRPSLPSRQARADTASLALKAP